MVMTNKVLSPLQIAEAEHEQFGGILLIDSGKPRVCTGCVKDAPCKCRDDGHVNSLAPSWSEAAPENINRVQVNEPGQQNLF